MRHKQFLLDELANEVARCEHIGSSMTKAIKSARLAIGEETIGNETAAMHIARTAGVLAQRAGMTLDALYAALPGIDRSNCWGPIVDGYYDAAEGN